MKFIFLIILSVFMLNPIISKGQNLSTSCYEEFKKTDGFVALWDFKEEQGKAKTADNKYPLVDIKGTVERVNEGPLSGYSAQFNGDSYLQLDYKNLGELNITSPGVTVIAWIKWTGEQIGFIGGAWNEYEDGGKRQYGLFVSLPHYNGKNQVCGHISKTGKPTPPFPYSIDYSASKQEVPSNEWCNIGFTYDGEYIKSYFNGVFEPREEELIMNTTGFDGYPNGLVQSKNPYKFIDGIGDNGSDFTVGAVFVNGKMGNFYKGLIGGLLIFSRALTEDEMRKISTYTK